MDGQASPGFTNRLADQLIRWRWALLSVALAITAAGIWPSTQLRFDTSIVNMFAADDPILVDYVHSTELFGGDEVIVVSYTDPELLTAAGLLRVHELAHKFRKIGPSIQQVLCLADSPWPLSPLDPRPLYRQVESRQLNPETLKEALLGSHLFRNLLIGEDGQTTALSLSLRLRVSDQERDDTIIADTNRPFDTVVAGGPMLTHDAAIYVDQDSRTLGMVSTIVLSLVIGLLFRRIRWVVLPMAVVHVTLIWTKSLLWLTSAELSMVSTTLTALVTVVGVASMIQVTARYREERARAEVRDALQRTLATAGPAVFWASLTTAAGFASLLVTSIVPVRDFAIMLSMASLLVFLAAAALSPAVVLCGRRPSDPGTAPGEKQLDRLLTASMDWSLGHPWLVGLTALVLLVLTVAGILRIHSETDFTRNFRRSSGIVRAYTFVEERMGGIGLIELEFAAADGLTPEMLDRLRALESKLRENPRITTVLGIADILDFYKVGRSSLIRRLVSDERILSTQLSLLRSQRPEIIREFWNEDARQMRIMLRSRESAPSTEKDALIAWISQATHEHLDRPEASAEVRVTGIYVLLNHIVGGLMADQLNAFLLATAAVFTIMCIALRSVRLAIIGMVPKIGPILMVLGAMGWLGVPIDMGTPMIASVSMGISVGFSIHYLYRFRQERLAGVPFEEALRSTHRGVGGAMVFSNLALVVGFGVLTLSKFIPTVHFSVLVDVALIGGLAGNLLVLPVLLKLMPERERH